MKRLTSHSKHSGCPVPSKELGDICLEMDFCDNFDFCDGCPVGRLINRLCEYEDTGFTPKQVENIKKKPPTHKMSAERIVGIPKNSKSIIAYGCSCEDVAKVMKKVSNLSKCEPTHGVVVSQHLLSTITKEELLKKSFDEALQSAVNKANETINTISIKRLNSVNETVKFLAENNAFTFRNGKLAIIEENLPKNQLAVCNLKTKMILRIKNACG